MEIKDFTAAGLLSLLPSATKNADLKLLAEAAIKALGDQENASDSLQDKLDALMATPGAAGDTSALQQELQEKDELIAEMSKKLAILEATKDQEGRLVEHGGISKLLIGNKFKIQKISYTADQVANDPELLAHLFKKGSGSLVDPVAEEV